MQPITELRRQRGNPRNARDPVYPVTLDGSLPLEDQIVWELDANNGVSVSGTDVTGWADQRGTNDLNVINGTPQYVAAGAPNANDMVTFNGIDQSAERATFSGLPDFGDNRTLAIYVNYHGSGVGGVAYGQAGSFRRVYGACVSASNHFLFQVWGPDDLSTFFNATSYGWALQICTVCGSGLEMSIQVDSSILVTQTQALALNTNPSGSISVARELDGSPFVNMDLAAAWLWREALNQQQVLQLQAYISQRFG